MIGLRVGLLLAVVGLGLAACGGEDEQSAATTPTPHVAEGHGEEAGGGHGEAGRGPGATDANDLELRLDPSALRAGQTGEIGFEILDAGGDPITEFDVEHTKQVHLIVVSKDLRHFEHVHPKVSGHGTWRVAVTPSAPGDHRVIADVVHEGRRLALTADLQVGGDPVAKGQPAQDATFVARELKAGAPTSLRFRAPGRSEKYLGAAGHLVVLSEEDLEYLHVHAREDELAFEAEFPKAGRYVMFLEYKRAGRVRLARFETVVR